MNTQKTLTAGDVQKTALRLPRPLHEQIHRAAEANGRSMNAEIVTRLQDSFLMDAAGPGNHDGINHDRLIHDLMEMKTVLNHLAKQLVEQRDRESAGKPD